MEYLLSAVPVLLFGTGIFYLIRLKGFYLLHPLRTLRPVFTVRRTDGISPLRALSMALAGTLGVGNIVGVASALYLGGAGAVFWMVFSALVAMVLKYAEIVLAVRHRRMDSDGRPTGGAPYYIRDGLTGAGAPRLGKWLAAVFAVLCTVNAFTMGSVLQANAVAGAMEGGFGVPVWVSGGVLAFLCAVVAFGGVRRIAAWTERLVPLMTVVFLVLCSAVLILRRDRLGDAFAEIFVSAFNVRSAGAGVFGFLLSRGMRYGVMRGLVSNEAGCGTAPMAHATADVSSPAEQGVLGLVEVFVDTVLLCTVTALTILVSDSKFGIFGDDGVRIAQAAFSSVLGAWSGSAFAVMVLLFGAATVLCWSHYGMTCVGFLSKRPWARWLYTIAFCMTTFAGALTAPEIVWSFADGALAVMTILNLLILWLMHREVEEETQRTFGRER